MSSILIGDRQSKRLQRRKEEKAHRNTKDGAPFKDWQSAFFSRSSFEALLYEIEKIMLQIGYGEALSHPKANTNSL